jgi:3-hydroxyisobutyrate dehydrogenase-like beta-hydroxyacid dehydrogenase
MLGEQGVASAGRAGLVAVDMSTIRPAAARDIGARLREQGVDFLDAPVSGGEVGAIAGSLSIMVGGSVAAFETARPAFECMGKNIVHVGDSGAGQVAKAANQIVTGAGVLTVAEALNFAARSGVDPAKVREACSAALPIRRSSRTMASACSTATSSRASSPGCTRRT